MKLDALDFILLGLATYRLALLISKDNGPFWVFKHLRRWVKRETPRKAHVDEGISCLWCSSVWVGIAVSVSAWFLYGHPVYRVAVLALALSAVAVILNQSFTKG